MQVPPDDLTIFSFGIAPMRGSMDMSGGPVGGFGDRARGPAPMLARTLAPPSGMAADPRSIMAGRGTDRYDAAIRLEGAMGVGEIASAYASQIGSSGWRAEGRGVDGMSMAVTRFVGPVRNGSAIVADLVVTRLTPTIVDVVLHALRTTSSAASASSSTYGSYAPAGGSSYSSYSSANPSASSSGAGGNLNGIPAPVLSVLRLGPLTVDSRETYDVRNVAPPEFPRDLLPAGAQVAVATRSPRLTVVVATASDFPAGSVPNFVMRLTNSGWMLGNRVTGGFNAGVETVQLCKSRESATLHFVPQNNTIMMVRAAVERLIGGSNAPCSPAALVSAPWNDIVVPTLRPPTDALASPMETAGGVDAWDGAMRFDSKQPLADVTQHLVNQLTTAGWKLEGRVEDGSSLTAVRFTGAGSTNVPFAAILTCTSLGSTGSYDAWLRVLRHNTVRR